jgi:hypothetical protein
MALTIGTTCTAVGTSDTNLHSSSSNAIAVVGIMLGGNDTAGTGVTLNYTPSGGSQGTIGEFTAIKQVSGIQTINLLSGKGNLHIAAGGQLTAVADDVNKAFVTLSYIDDPLNEA